jgi:hypothetical protein
LTAPATRSAKAVGGDKTERDQFRERFLNLGTQKAAHIHQFVEERRAVFLDAVGKQLRPGGRMRRSVAGG